VAVGSQVQIGVLGKSIVLPLLLSPLIAVTLGASFYLAIRWSRLRLGITKEWCICVGNDQQVVPVPQPTSVLAFQATAPMISACVGEITSCSQRCAGIVSFARGLNDTPKMAALLLVLPMMGAYSSLVTVAMAIAVGGLLSARRVAETMSHKITGMNHGQGFSANLATGVLVTTASLFALPVSTTHVSVGSLFGIGLTNRQADLSVIRKILLSWIVTVRCSNRCIGLSVDDILGSPELVDPTNHWRPSRLPPNRGLSRYLRITEDLRRHPMGNTEHDSDLPIFVVSKNGDNTSKAVGDALVQQTQSPSPRFQIRNPCWFRLFAVEGRPRIWQFFGGNALALQLLTIVADFREACLPALASLFAAVAIDTTTMPTAFTARFRLLLGEAKKAYGKNACRRDYRRAFDDRLYHVEFSRSAHGGLLEVGCHVRKFVRR
jgi:hypothetical protein